MAERFDVAARLAEGRPAVEHTQTYVRACHGLGYQHPDLTAHGSQLYDWYDTEAGLDLRVLDQDSAELWAAANAIEEALQVQRTQIDELAATWSGPGADSATRFLRRHCEAASAVAAHVRAAAERCSALRDELWQMVDSKATTAIAIDDRRVAERSAWLAAAHTVTTGAGDRSVAEELVRQQVNPYVDNDIRIDWLTAMRSSTASVAASYDAVTDALTLVPEAWFEIPGELGPSRRLVFDEPPDPGLATRAVPEVSLPADPAPTVPTVPAAASTPLPPTTAAPPTLPADALAALSPVPPELASPLGDAAGLSSGAGNLGGSGGLGGLAGKIVDGIGGLLGSLADGFADLSGPGDPLDTDDVLAADDPLDVEEADEDDEDDDEPDEADDDPSGADEDAASESTGESSPPADDAVDEPAAQQVTVPPTDTPPPDEPPDEPSPSAPPPPAEPSTSASEPQSEEAPPCEIAADELPQAGQ